MEIVSTQKFLRMSPRKIRLVANMVKKLTPENAIEALMFIHKRAALSLTKVIKSALSTANLKGKSNLVFKEIQVGEGPRLKRGNPVSRGRWHPIKKRMSHIRVVLTEKKSETNSRSETSTEKLNKEGEK